LAFLDEEEGAPPPEVPERPRRPENGPRRKRQQYLVRRLIGVGVGIGFLILVVLAFRGCLEARKERGITNYVTDVGTIMSESEQAGGRFFDLLEQGGSSPPEFESQIRLIRGSSATLVDRAEDLNVPGQMSEANDAAVLALKLRRDALERIADSAAAALADAETTEAIETITNQMAALYSSDVLYSQVAAPEMRDVVEAEGISAPDPPPGNFMPNANLSSSQNIEWLESSRIQDALAGFSGEEIEAGSRGLALVQVTAGDIALSPDETNTISDVPGELAVDVQNQGSVEETTVTVVVSVDGRDLAPKTAGPVGPGATETVNVSLGNVTQGTEVTLDVLVETVVDELDASNNEASYTVIFGG
jgi:hypothetical protein